MNPTMPLMKAIEIQTPNMSQNARAEFIGIKKQTFSNWCTGAREIENLSTVVEICFNAGLDPAPWVQAFGEHFARSKKAIAWWAKVGKVAAITLAVYMAIPTQQAEASVISHIADHTMHCALIAVLAWFLIGAAAAKDSAHEYAALR